MKISFRSLGLALCISVLLPSMAWGWQPTWSCGPDIVPCEPGVEPVFTSWPMQCMGFHVHEEGSKHLSAEDFERVLHRSAAMWSSPTCSYLQLLSLGFTNEDRVGYHAPSEHNANILVFRDTEWRESKSIMALTTVTQDTITGEIFDADIEFNSERYVFSADPAGDLSVIDLESTLTHELGHAIGLAHSDIREATMFAYATSGDTSKRQIHRDDREGLCTLYPTAQVNAVQKCTAKPHFFEKPDYEMKVYEDEYACGCRIHGSQRTWPLGLGFLALSALGFMLLLRRRCRSV